MSEPLRRDAVIDVLPSGYADVMPRAQANAKAAVGTVADANALIAIAARSGDARLIARAEKILERYRGRRETPDSLRAQAYVAQYRHDFDTALKLLDRAIERDPRDADARLSRAQILLVGGDVERARSECASLAVGLDADRGLLCIAAVELRRGRYDETKKLLDHWIGRASPKGESARHALLMRAETASRSGDADADAWFRKALAVGPRDVRTLAAFSRHLRETGRPADALQALADAPASDHILLERALAAHQAGRTDARDLGQMLASRFELARQLGLEPDLRDEAEYWLTLRNDPKRALPLAQRNFEHQRDREDVDLLRRASTAAESPQAWAPVAAWAASQNVELPSPQRGAR
ncbi:tetratricopeptide repeat protein [Cognatilysobacter bugurensis]|uniref:tetratricopeptide repeat protein n=1 Tax=Cognatilysobacter bugurensis TaxID=543356 RepID=UPI00167A83EA|nr:tetratricopeptide repeat protein [Lysobacter bugurensis]